LHPYLQSCNLKRLSRERLNQRGFQQAKLRSNSRIFGEDNDFSLL